MQGILWNRLRCFCVPEVWQHVFLGGIKPKLGNPHKGNLKFMITMAFGKSKGSYTRKAVDAKRMDLKELCVYKEVPRQWMKQLLEAARLSPSSMNSQPWRFVL